MNFLTDGGHSRLNSQKHRAREWLPGLGAGGAEGAVQSHVIHAQLVRKGFPMLGHSMVTVGSNDAQ